MSMTLPAPSLGLPCWPEGASNGDFSDLVLQPASGLGLNLPLQRLMVLSRRLTGKSTL